MQERPAALAARRGRRRHGPVTEVAEVVREVVDLAAVERLGHPVAIDPALGARGPGRGDRHADARTHRDGCDGDDHGRTHPAPCPHAAPPSGTDHPDVRAPRGLGLPDLYTFAMAV